MTGTKSTTDKYFLEEVVHEAQGQAQATVLEVRADKPKGGAQAGRLCYAPRVSWPPKGEDTGARLPLYSLHTASRFEFLRDAELLTTCGIWLGLGLGAVFNQYNYYLSD